MRENSILIIHHGALGDFILAFTALVRLRKRFQHIAAVCVNALGCLGHRLGMLDRWMPSESACFANLYGGAGDARLRHWFAPFQHILLFSFSEDLHRGIRKNAPGQVHRIPPHPKPRRRIHVSKFIAQHLQRANLCDPDASESPNWIKRLHDPPVRPAGVLIHPGAGSPRKMWPIENFIELEARLKSAGRRAEFVLGPAEQHLKTRLLSNQADSGRRVHCPEDLLELVDLLRSACGYVGNDSGVSHLAGFLGLPTVAVFGPSDDLRWHPCGPRVRVCRSRPDCLPCFEIRKTNCANPECLTLTSPQTVLAALDGC